MQLHLQATNSYSLIVGQPWPEAQWDKHQGWFQHQINGGIMEKSLFLEGLKSAREIIQNKGIQYLDSIIEELDFEKKENTAIKIKAETR